MRLLFASDFSAETGAGGSIRPATIWCVLLLTWSLSALWLVDAAAVLFAVGFPA